MATQVLPSQVADGITKTNGVNGKAFKSKNQQRRAKLRAKKAEQKAKPVRRVRSPHFLIQRPSFFVLPYNQDDPSADESTPVSEEAPNDVEYVFEQLDIKGSGFEEFADVLARFQHAPEVTSVRRFPLSCSSGRLLTDVNTSGLIQGVKNEGPSKGEIIYSDDDMASEGDSDAEGEKKPLSKKKARKLNRLTVAELKQLVKKPEAVEWTDVTASDPRLLLQLKSYRNTVPIPAHWSAKRDYLQGKRGIEKPPFQLPSYIADTGIATMRDAIKEKEANMSLKAKTRERVQPKMGKVDIDYQKLHDAFFKFMTKPNTTSFGELYAFFPRCCRSPNICSDFQVLRRQRI